MKQEKNCGNCYWFGNPIQDGEGLCYNEPPALVRVPGETLPRSARPQVHETDGCWRFTNREMFGNPPRFGRE